MLLRRQKLIDQSLAWAERAGVVPAVVAPVRRAVGIEKLLAWTYRDELPKMPRAEAPAGFGEGWGAMSEFAEELSLAGRDANRFGVVADLSAARFPHADALRVHQAVASLDEVGLEIPEGWAPISDLGALGEAGDAAVVRALERVTCRGADGRRRLRETPRRLVVHHAIMGGAPEWQAEAPVLRQVIGANGQAKWFRRVLVPMETVSGGEYMMEVEIDGFCSRRGAPHDDAFMKEYLDPCPEMAIIGRAEYEVWHAALGLLAAELEGELALWDVQGPVRAVRPWEDAGAMSGGRVLRDLSSRCAV